jgi:hypothetical protein
MDDHRVALAEEEDEDRVAALAHVAGGVRRYLDDGGSARVEG